MKIRSLRELISKFRSRYEKKSGIMEPVPIIFRCIDVIIFGSFLPQLLIKVFTFSLFNESTNKLSLQDLISKMEFECLDLLINQLAK